jgi:hypothetical protein
MHECMMIRINKNKIIRINKNKNKIILINNKKYYFDTPCTPHSDNEQILHI